MNDERRRAPSRKPELRGQALQRAGHEQERAHRPPAGEWGVVDPRPRPGPECRDPGARHDNVESSIARHELSGRDLAPGAAYCQVCPSDLPNAADRNRAAAVSQLIINIERHLPSGTPSLAGKWLASLWRA